jgi:hypothetical protein
MDSTPAIETGDTSRLRGWAITVNDYHRAENYLLPDEDDAQDDEQEDR